jgi:hypothetical protein
LEPEIGSTVDSYGPEPIKAEEEFLTGLKSTQFLKSKVLPFEEVKDGIRSYEGYESTLK